MWRDPTIDTVKVIQEFIEPIIRERMLLHRQHGQLVSSNFLDYLLKYGGSGA
jgi:hypothetical protein